jgi:hypothetical protein
MLGVTKKYFFTAEAKAQKNNLLKLNSLRLRVSAVLKKIFTF